MLHVGSQIVAQLSDFIIYSMQMMRRDEIEIMEEISKALPENIIAKIDENLIKVIDQRKWGLFLTW